MEVKNCKRCGRLFNELSGEEICPVCRKTSEDEFVKVKEYVLENKGASVEKVAKENNVSIKRIRQWIKEERLELSDPLLSGITCEKCGVPICTGRYCERCKTNMANNLMNAFKKPKPQAVQKKQKRDQKMRFIHNDK